MISRRSEFICPTCGDVRGDRSPTCPRCGVPYEERVSIHTEDSATMTDTEELVGEESRPGLEAVVFKSFDGMRSHATLANATVELTLRGPLDLGRQGEPRVADRIVSVLKSEGRAVELIPHEDSKGEDSRIKCDGTDINVQVVTVPGATQFLREANQGSASTSVPIAQAAAWINDAASAKAAHYSATQKAGTLLALDVRHVSVLASEQVVQSVERLFGDPCRSHGFGAVWLVGPLDSRCTKFPLSRW